MDKGYGERREMPEQSVEERVADVQSGGCGRVAGHIARTDSIDKVIDGDCSKKSRLTIGNY